MRPSKLSKTVYAVVRDDTYRVVHAGVELMRGELCIPVACPYDRERFREEIAMTMGIHVHVAAFQVFDGLVADGLVVA